MKEKGEARERREGRGGRGKMTRDAGQDTRKYARTHTHLHTHTHTHTHARTHAHRRLRPARRFAVPHRPRPRVHAHQRHPVRPLKSTRKHKREGTRARTQPEFRTLYAFEVRAIRHNLLLHWACGIILTPKYGIDLVTCFAGHLALTRQLHSI